MNKLIIKTRYHVTVELLLMHFQMIEKHHHVEVMNDGIEVDHPDDGLSQDLVFWLGNAQVCGLVDDYQFDATPEQDVLQNILNTAQSGLRTGGTWRMADRIEVLKDALEDIVKICQEQMKEDK